jgi:hypothetical protein
MTAFANFRTQARAEFPALTVKVMMYEEQTATGNGHTMYRLRALGMVSDPAALTATAISPSEAITALHKLVGTPEVTEPHCAAVTVDFADFRTQARAEFATLNLSVMMYEVGHATDSRPIVYRLQAQGMAIGPAALSAEATSPSEAIKALRTLVIAARRTHRAKCDASAQARHRASNPNPVARPQLARAA